MSVGDPIRPGRRADGSGGPALVYTGEGVPQARMDARGAAAAILAAYLLPVVFRVRGGDEGGEDREFQLRQVLGEWPDPTVALPYPCASIVDAGAILEEAHDLTPTPLEDTADQFGPGTMLWHLADLDHVFQLDFWTTNAADREAISARLPGLFAPYELRGGVILEGHPAYYCLPLRASLVSRQRADSPAAVGANERRLLTRVRASIPVVELRRATLLDVRTELDLDPTCQE